MADEIVLAPRKNEAGEVIEGEIHLKMNPELTKDIEIIAPNKNSRYVTRESLESGDLNLSILGGVNILTPLNNATDSNGTFKVSNYLKYETYDGVPSAYIFEISDNPDFTTIKKSFTRSDFNTEFAVSFEKGNETLYARARTITDLHISNNSPTVKFKTLPSYVHKPKILTPTNGVTGTAWEVFVSVSDYMYIGEGNYCDGLVCEYSTTPTFAEGTVEELELYRDENEGTPLDFSDYVKTFFLKELNENTKYYIRVAYVGKVYGTSAWSDVVSFTTYDMPDTKIVASSRKFYSEPLFSDNFDDKDTRYVLSSGLHSLFLTKTDRKYNAISTYSMDMNESYLKDLIIKSAFIQNGYFYIFGVAEYDYAEYVGPLKKHFVSKVKTDMTTAESRFFNVSEDIEVDDEGKMLPYVSNVDITNVSIYDDFFIVFGVIPNPVDKNKTIASTYVLNKELNIVSFKNYSLGGNTVFKDVYNNGTNIFAVGKAEADLGSGVKSKALVSKFEFDVENGELSILQSKVYGTGTTYDIGQTVASIAEDILLVSYISSNIDTNIGTANLMVLDTDLIIKNTYSIPTAGTGVSFKESEYDKDKIRLVGGITSTDSFILDLNVVDFNNPNVIKSKRLNGYMPFNKTFSSLNSIVCFGNETNILCLNDDLGVIGNGISDVGISPTNGLVIINIQQSNITLDNLTNEFIVEVIPNTLSTTANSLVKTIIS